MDNLLFFIFVIASTWEVLNTLVTQWQLKQLNL